MQYDLNMNIGVFFSCSAPKMIKEILTHRTFLMGFTMKTDTDTEIQVNMNNDSLN